MPHPEQEEHANGKRSVGAARRLRVYEAWEGNEKFFCWGYLISGPNWKAVIGTSFIVIAPVVIYLTFVASYMTLQRSAAIMVFSCILPVLAMVFLFMTACSDPGIIPRRQPDEEYLQGRKPRTKEVLVNNHRIVTRYNDTCHLYQPPRAHHCSVNDNCIERFDHHCPWVGTTVGKRNYRTFLLFIYTATVLCLYAFGNSLASLFVRHSELVDRARAKGESGDDKWGETIGDTIPSIVIMAYTFLLFWFVGGLSGFHAYLVATNQTTYETFRYRHEDRPNPYDKGILANCAEVWCSRIEPSKVKFRAFVDEMGEADADLETGGRGAREGVECGQQQQQHHVAPQQVPAFHGGTPGGEGAQYAASQANAQMQQQYMVQQELELQQQQQQHGELIQPVLYPPPPNSLAPFHQPDNEERHTSTFNRTKASDSDLDVRQDRGRESFSVDSKDIEVDGIPSLGVVQSEEEEGQESQGLGVRHPEHRNASHYFSQSAVRSPQADQDCEVRSEKGAWEETRGLGRNINDDGKK